MMQARQKLKTETERTTAKVTSVFLVSFSVLLLVAGMFLSHRGQKNAEARILELRAQLKPYLNGRKNFPSEEKGEYLKQQQQRLNHLLSESRDYPIYADTLIPVGEEVKSPLSLKEKIFEIKKSLQKKASEEGLLIPDDIGFKYWEESLPARDKVAEIQKDLYFAKAIIDHLIHAKVERLESVQLLDAQQMSYHKNGQYTERRAKIELSGTSERILDFLELVLTTGYFLNIENYELGVQTEEEKTNKNGMIHADVTISGICVN